jgi:hypothetical protein
LGGVPPRQWLQNWLTPWLGDEWPNAAEEIDALLGVYDRSSLMQFWATPGSGPAAFEFCQVVLATIAEEWLQITATQLLNALWRGPGRPRLQPSGRGRPKTFGVRLAVALDFTIACIPELTGTNWRHGLVAALVQDAVVALAPGPRASPWTRKRVKREVTRNRGRRRRPAPCATYPVAPIYVATSPGAWLVRHGLLPPLTPHEACGDGPRIPVIAYSLCFKGPTAPPERAMLLDDLEATGFSILPTRA